MEKMNSGPEVNNREEGCIGIITEPTVEINIESARQHLDNVSDQYFEAINKYTEQEFLNFVKKLEPLSEFMQSPRSVVSIGVGGGIELRVLYELFKEKNTEIIGVDLSRKAIASAQNYLKEHNTQVSLIQSSAVEMPFKYNNTHIDGIVLSAVMHEIYSYVEDGKTAWIKAVQEASRVLSDGGVLLLRDFAGPETNDNDEVEILFLNQESKDFYNYFIERFRTFDNWSGDEVKKMKDKRNKHDNYPLLSENQMSVTLPFGIAAELMLHCRNYVSDFKNGIINVFPNDWKEIDERYFVPDPDTEVFSLMSSEKYKEKVLLHANNKLKQDGYKLECLRSKIIARPDTVNEIKKYFSVKHKNKTQEELLGQITSKMELVFKKQLIK